MSALPEFSLSAAVGSDSAGTSVRVSVSSSVISSVIASVVAEDSFLTMNPYRFRSRQEQRS